MAASIKGISPNVAGPTSDNLGSWPTNGTITPAMPTDTGAPAEGDLILLPVYVRNSAQTIDDVTGYTRLTTNDFTSGANTVELWAKVATSSESAPTVTDSQTATQPTAAILLVVEGWSGDLGDLVATIAGSTGSTVTCPDATATADDSLVIRFGFQQDDNQSATAPVEPPPPWVPWDEPDGHTPAFYEVTMAGSDAGMAVAYATANTGAVGTAAFATSGNDAGIGVTLIIPPSAGGEPVTGSANTVFTFATTATGRHTAKGSAAASWTFTTTAAGSRTGKGSAATSWAFDAPATGTVAGSGSGSASTVFTFTAGASGRHTGKGTAATTWTFTAATAGQHTAKGSASTAFGFSAPVVVNVAPTRADMDAAVAATRTAFSTVTAARTATAAATAANTQTSGVS